jgi:hypothetical protein
LPGSSCAYTQSSSAQGPAVTINSGNVCDLAGNCTRLDAGPFQIDSIVPAVSLDPTADSCSLPGDNGWCRFKQTAGFSAADGTSGIASPCTAAAGLSCNFTNVTKDPGAAVMIPSLQVCDVAGNCNPGIDAGPFKIDGLPPALAPTVGPAPILLHGSASAAPNATDSTSGVASQSCGAVDTSTAGLRTLSCTARDNAGNVTTVSVGYLVEYKIQGFILPPPGSHWKRGRTVPVKVKIVDAHNVPISDAEAKGLLSPTCRVKFSASGAQSAIACMDYHKGKNEFVYDWKLGQQTGNVTISVTISYPGTASTTVLSEPISVTN